jgi:hypothetical protein
MSSVKYAYSISEDFPNAKVLPDKLASEIRASAIETALDYIGTSGDVCDVWFRAELSTSDNDRLDSIVAAHDAVPVSLPQLVTVDGHQKNKAAPVALVGREGSETVKVTLNFCDQHTWYPASLRVTGGVLVDDGDHRHYSFPSGHIPIDLYGGRVYNEVKIRQQVDHQYQIIVYVDGVPQTDGYSLDFELNNIVFDESQGDSIVTADYSRAYKSCWTLFPSENRVLDIEESVIFWTDDIIMTGDIFMDVGFHTGSEWVSIEEVMRYSTLYQIIDEAAEVYRVYAGGGEERGFTNHGQKAKIRYTTVRRLKWSDEYMGFKIGLRITLLDHLPFVGERATATFWAVSTLETELEG